MIVVNVTNAPPKLRGFLTKYLWEIDAGVYVGKANSRIREALWKRIIENCDQGKATMVFPSDNEQGFDFYTTGSAWSTVDVEGLKLIKQFKNGNNSDNGTKSAFPDRYIVLDLETTGLDIAKDRILEIGAIRFVDGKEAERFNRLIKTVVPQNIEALTGITQEMSNEGVELKLALEELAAFIAGDITVGYNIRAFDIRILKNECARSGVVMPVDQITDVLEIIKRKRVGIKSFNLSDVAEYFGVSLAEGVHRAIPDCIMCNEVYLACV